MNSSPTKSAPTRLFKSKIERARLLKRLIDERQKNCVLLHGPAGCGKTTLAMQWRADLVPFGYDFAMVTVSACDDFEALLDALFVSIDRVDPQIASEASVFYNRDGGVRSAEALAISFVKGFARHKRPLVVLIDDYQNITDGRAHQFVQTLLDFAPSNLRLALFTRSVPPLSLSRLRGKGATLELDFRDLRFSFAETEEFVRARHPEVTRRDVRILYDLTNGWAAGLQLLSLNLSGLSQRAKSDERVHNAEEFSAYFQREVLSHLSDDELDALARLAVPRRFNAGLGAALLGQEAASTLMERLRRDNLFLLPADSERETNHRFHPLFRDLLLARFEGMPVSERRRTHATIGDWYGRRGQLRETVRHCIAAGDIELAAQWLERGARTMFLNGELRSLVSVVAELPRTVLASRVSLRLWVAWAQLCYRRLAECHESLDALKATLRSDDDDSRDHLTLLEGSLAIQEDDTAAAVRLLPDLEAMAPATDAILAGGRRNILGWLYIHVGECDRARACLTGPRPLLEDGSQLVDSAFGALTGRQMIGFSYLHEGDMRRAEPVLRDVLAEAERLLGTFCEPACNAAGLLSDVLYETNDLGALQALLEPRLDAIERLGLPDTLLRPSVMLSRLHRMLESRQEAMAEIDRLEDYAHQRGLDRLLAHALAERARLLLTLAQPHAADEALAQLRFVAKRQERSAAPSRDKIAMLADMTQVRCLGAGGRIDEARALIMKCIDRSSHGVQRRFQVQQITQLALLDGQLGRTEPAERGISQAIHAAHELGLVRSLIDYGKAFFDLAEQACTAGRMDTVTSFYLERLQAQTTPTAAPVRPASAVQQEPLSERELEIVHALAHAMPNKRIAQALGISLETVKWHLKNIYGKFGVIGRDAAIGRARDLGLLGPN